MLFEVLWTHILHGLYSCYNLHWLSGLTNWRGSSIQSNILFLHFIFVQTSSVDCCRILKGLRWCQWIALDVYVKRLLIMGVMPWKMISNKMLIKWRLMKAGSVVMHMNWWIGAVRNQTIILIYNILKCIKCMNA